MKITIAFCQGEDNLTMEFYPLGFSPQHVNHMAPMHPVPAAMIATGLRGVADLIEEAANGQG